MAQEKDNMAKTQEPTIAEDQQISLTLEQLQSLISEATKEQQKDSDSKFSELISALIETRKPYVDPGQELNKEVMRQSERQQQAAIDRNRKWAQDSCLHVKGLGGQEPGSASAFWIHRSDTGETIGVCSFCQRVISSLNPDDQRFFAMKGSNVPSQAGQRAFLDPIKAMTARFSEEERKKIIERLHFSAS